MASEPSDANYFKAETRKQWNSTPCGTGEFLTDTEPESLAWFDKIRYERYYATDPWMKRVIPFDDFVGKRLLEVGHGIGSDLLSFALGGAQVHGIDITEEHHRLARLNLDLHGTPAELKLCDACHIEYPSNHFDVVYSHGVLHHTPDITQCIADIYRVLKPGGVFILSMYYKCSAFHLLTLLLAKGLLRGELWRLGYRGLMATVEEGSDGITKKPLVRTYSKRQVRRLLQALFEVKQLKVAHFQRSHVPRLGTLLPKSLLPTCEQRLGWYVIAFAIKPQSVALASPK